MKRILFYIVFGYLSVFLFQQHSSIFKIEPLKGVYSETKKPCFKLGEFKSTDFQKAYEAYFNENAGFRDFLVRLNNQLDYSLFNLAGAEGVVACRNDNLLEEDYIFAYYGVNYIGENAIDKKMRRFKFVQEKLAEKGKFIVFILEPGKAGVFPELIPDQYSHFKSPGPNNYDIFIKKAQEYGVNCLDLMAYFKVIKHTAPYPVFPPQGTHWSQYGSVLAADTLLNYLKEYLQFTLGKMTIDSIQISDNPRHADYDAGNAMNLLFKIHSQPLAYPSLSFKSLPVSKRPSVLVNGDSFFWNILITGIPANIFKNTDFWYYNTESFGNKYVEGKGIPVNTLNLQDEVDKHDLFIVMVTERFLYNYDFRFIDNLFELFSPELYKDEIYTNENSIRSLADWIKSLEKKAKATGISLEKAINGDAVYMLGERNKENLVLIQGPTYYENQIKFSPDWIEIEKQKAKEKKITLSEMIKIDAVYMFKTEFPNTYNKYIKIEDIKRKILNNPGNIAILKNNPWYLKPDEMLWQEAFARYEGRYLLASITL